MGEYLKYKAVTIRKPHVCFGCGREFKPPCKMFSTTWVDGGMIYSDYICKTCDKVVSEMCDYDEFGFGELRDYTLEMEKTVNGD